MADIGISPANTEVLVNGLQFGLQNQASMITSRREVQVSAQPGFYDPSSSRLIRIHIADGSSWWQMGTTKLVFELHNTSTTHALELIVPPLGLFDQFRLLSQGSVIETIESYSRTVSTYDSLLPLEARVTNSLEAIKKKDPFGKQVENADGRAGLEEGTVYAGGTNTVPKKTAFEVERYVTIPPSGKKTISTSILSGLLNSQYMWPLMHCNMTLEFQLVSNPSLVLASSLPALANGMAAMPRSQQFQIHLPRLEMSFNTLSQPAQAEFDSLISGEGLILPFTYHTTLQQSIFNKDSRVQFFRSLANVKDILCTLYRPYCNSAASTDAGDSSLTALGRALLKECNYMWGASDQILQDTTSTKRGEPQANGVPSPTPAGQEVHDISVSATTFQIVIGAKQIPEVPIQGGQVIYHNKMALGLESMREGFSNMHSFDISKKVFSVNLEKYTGMQGIDGSGMTTRAGESIMAIFANAGTDTLYPEKIYMHLRSSAKLELRTGSIRLMM